MTVNDNGIDTIINPKLGKPYKNVTKTSVNLLDDLRKYLNTIKCANISDYINKAVASYVELDLKKQETTFRYDNKEYIKTEVWLHKEVAEFLLLIERINGAICLADKLAEVICNDPTNTIMKGDAHLYGIGKDDFDKIIHSYTRAIKRLQDE